MFTKDTFIGPNAVKTLAYDTLIEHGISALPLTLPYRSRNIVTFSIQFLAKCFHEDVKVYNFVGEYGFCCYEPKHEQYVIFYNANLPEEMIRWVKAMGIAYAELGVLDRTDYKFINLHDAAAEEFCHYFTSPDVILNECQICSSEEIMKYCGIPFRQARKKQKNLTLPQKNKAGTVLEKLLKERFSEFIRHFKY